LLSGVALAALLAVGFGWYATAEPGARVVDESNRWLTVVSPEDPHALELVQEPDEHPAARPFKAALVTDGMPFTSFAVADVHAETQRLQALGVTFTQVPAKMGPVTTAVLDDTCGNLLQITSM
jgi:hypothetical protein